MMRYAGNRHIIKILHETLWADNVTGSSLTLLHTLRLKWLLFSHHVRSTVTFDSFIEKAADERVSKLSDSKKDFMFWLTGAVDPVTGDTFTMEELVEEAILLITAVGSDTSSTAISSTIYYLLHSPDKLARLQTEVRMEPGGVHVGDIFYPEGVNIGVPVFSIHHDKEYFPDPFLFQPERWIVGETLADGTIITPDFLKHSSAAFMAFSAGTRGCIGKPLAYLQISILFATLMFKYDMRLCQQSWVNGTCSGPGPDPSKEYELVDMFISWKNGPLIEVKPKA
ncbi:hypothetical protein K4K58_004796 [Colletotrichum sp. SAR11_239]|nr:hypothetical protein K4K58_004796 [Colletotrichum sp. SAR11_239]